MLTSQNIKKTNVYKKQGHTFEPIPWNYVNEYNHIDGQSQERQNSNALAMELPFSCTYPLMS